MLIRVSGLLGAILTVHRLQDGKLNVRDYGSYLSYDFFNDAPTQKYFAARGKLSAHKKLSWVLKKIGYVK
jgi:hypothetical protein